MAGACPPLAILVPLAHVHQRHGQEVGKEIPPLALGKGDQRLQRLLETVLSSAPHQAPYHVIVLHAVHSSWNQLKTGIILSCKLPGVFDIGPRLFDLAPKTRLIAVQFFDAGAGPGLRVIVVRVTP